MHHFFKAGVGFEKDRIASDQNGQKIANVAFAQDDGLTWHPKAKQVVAQQRVFVPAESLKHGVGLDGVNKFVNEIAGGTQVFYVGFKFGKMGWHCQRG